MNTRTDLVFEQGEIFKNFNEDIKNITETIGSTTLHTVEIYNDTVAKSLQKPFGTYCTVLFPRLDFVCDTADIINATVKALKTVMHDNFKSALVVGLGNTDITPDAIGPFVANRMLATRHLGDDFKQCYGLDGLKQVSCLVPNVLGKTGIESCDLVTAAAKKVSPDIVIVVDALACRDPARLCRTIQITDSGICPGAGVNNSRKELSQKTVGVPVIAVGIPTVIDANGFFDTDNNMMVTPKEIDLLAEKSAQILARAINIFLQPKLDIDIIESLT